MAIIKLLLLFTSIVCIQASPMDIKPPVATTTIFGDEMLQGEIFHNMLRELEVIEVPSSDYRLPTTTRPISYDWTVRLDMTNMRIFGEVAISLVATQPDVNEIVIHSKDLDINTVVLTQNANLIDTSFDEDEDLEFLKISLASGFLAFNVNTQVVHVLRITYDGHMRDDMYGIYPSWYKTGTETKWMATTQFQATSARGAFPCYDEPSFKATFDIHIVRPINYKSWSCMRQENPGLNTNIPGYERDDYYTTPVMSTYLLALIVAEYESRDVRVNDLITHEVIARPDAINNGQGDYALRVGQDLLAKMNEHTDIDFYSVNEHLKMTQASIPDFGAGAMENWGLLTYREAYLMYTQEHTDVNYQQRIANILSHEIAHMWFGNLVTCDWWDVLWLNEGFARYYQYFLTHWVKPEMDFETRFITEQVHTALLSDSSLAAHPLTNPGIGSPSSVSSMFSTISYNKGAAVIRMTEHLLGSDNHERGLREYLQSRREQTALPIHLFESLQTVATSTGAIAQYGPGFSVIDYYRSWTEQAGHPVLNVQVDHHTGDMVIMQRRFDINNGHTPATSNWIIPINFASETHDDFTDTKPTHIITEGVTIINRGSVGDEWVIFNKQQTGFYRVNYDDYTWDLIVLALRSEDRTNIHEYNRAQIVNDVCQFARSGLMPYPKALNILSFLQYETDYAPWTAAVTCFTWLRNRYIGTAHLEELDETIIGWSSRVMTEIGYTPAVDEDFMDTYLRYQLAPFVCLLGVEACRTAATTQFQQLLANPSVEVPVNNRLWVYCNALREGNEEHFDFLWQRFETHNVYTEKILILQTIGCTPSRAKLYEFLHAITARNELVRPQDYTTAWNSAVTGNEGNTQIVFDFFKEFPEQVRIAFDGYTTPLSYISARLRTSQEVDDYQEWVADNRALFGTEFDDIYRNSVAAHDSLTWAQANAEGIAEYLEEGDEDITRTTPDDTPPEPPSFVERPVVPVPVNPEIPDSAAGVYVSLLLICASLAANLF